MPLGCLLAGVFEEKPMYSATDAVLLVLQLTHASYSRAEVQLHVPHVETVQEAVQRLTAVTAAL